ncbi:hypothetical protein FB45DRAFT_1036244 [Roridomyces roridus]|uniref:Uncharacterized protein n=1 Tax=Roridomyces roridus TaxID=1738132 RepID=A0AAD7B9F8_9AGAR|nr:hypothetical protein FB45DRAFT_1036244 [Roridomyces roridus]
MSRSMDADCAYLTLTGVDTSGLRGRLPRLRDFQVICDVRLEHCKPVTPLDFLETAPFLNKIRLPTPLLRSEALRTISKQLADLSLIVMPHRDELHTVLRLLPEMSVGAGFYLALDLDPTILPRNWEMELYLPSITASLRCLACKVCSAGVQADAHQLTSTFSQLAIHEPRFTDLGHTHCGIRVLSTGDAGLGTLGIRRSMPSVLSRTLPEKATHMFQVRISE